MSKLGRSVGKKATKATVKHSARGLSSKAKRQPLRSVSLLSVGGAVGVTIGWFARRKTASA
jgi:hypothetical protein